MGIPGRSIGVRFTKQPTLRSVRRSAGLVLAASLLSACVESPDAPSAEVDQNQLASSFDALAQEMVTADVERSEEFRWAALALRAGVRPTALEVTNDGQPEVYDAFVHAVKWVSATEALRPSSHRNLVAWRRGSDRLQILLVGLATDSAPVLHPYSMRPTVPGGPVASPVAGAIAAYFERGASNTTWIGIGGAVKIVEKPAGSTCGTGDDSARPSGIGCQLTRFGVQFTILVAQTPSRDSRDVDQSAPTRRLVAADQTVAGVKLMFSCLEPTSSGC